MQTTTLSILIHLLLENLLKCSIRLRVNYFLESNQQFFMFNNFQGTQLLPTNMDEIPSCIYSNVLLIYLIHVFIHVVFVCLLSFVLLVHRVGFPQTLGCSQM